ncbi:hypothetical protein BCD64_01535 [Nostoc sp. MBR 210]|nr:hypothetical protein BCD64_01535 [Nostoc sp. MBR 210]
MAILNDLQKFFFLVYPVLLVSLISVVHISNKIAIFLVFQLSNKNEKMILEGAWGTQPSPNRGFGGRLRPPNLVHKDNAPPRFNYLIQHGLHQWFIR